MMRMNIDGESLRVAFLPKGAVMTHGSRRRFKRLIRKACAQFGTKEVRFRPSPEVGRWIAEAVDAGIAVEEIG